LIGWKEKMQKKWQALVTLDIPEIGIRILKKCCEVEVNKKDAALSKEEIIARIYNKHALCCSAEDMIDTEVMDSAPNLKIIARFGTGCDNVDIKSATQRKIMVTNTPGALTEAVSEMTLGLFFSLARRLVEADSHVRAGKFKRSSPKSLLGTEMRGKTLGVIGAGKIGTAVARKAQGFGMDILYHDVVRNEKLEEIGGKRVTIDYLLQHSDFISIHVSLTTETTHLIGRRELGLMKKTAYLINTSRGKVVNETALVKALQRKEIAGAALDVYENEPHIAREFLTMKNLVLTPHIASATKETWNKMAMMVAEDCLTALKGKRPPHLLNSEVWKD